MVLCLQFIVHFTFTETVCEFRKEVTLFFATYCFSVNYHCRVHDYYICNLDLHKNRSLKDAKNVSFPYV